MWYSFVTKSSRTVPVGHLRRVSGLWRLARMNVQCADGRCHRRASGDAQNRPYVGFCTMTSRRLSDCAESLWRVEFTKSRQRARDGEWVRPDQTVRNSQMAVFLKCGNGKRIHWKHNCLLSISYPIATLCADEIVDSI